MANVPDPCYLCGATSELTRDHIPPKAFFPRPRPENLITISCCRTCNESWQLDDDAVRAFFSLSLGRSQAGDLIWESRVLPSTVARSPAFREYLLERIKDLPVQTPNGIEFLPAFELPDERIERFMVRITKGLLRHFHPSYDYSLSIFSVRYVPPTEQHLQLIVNHLSGTAYEERGDGVIRFRHGISVSGLSGLWFYMFYDAVWYIVHHVQIGTLPEQQREGGI